MNRQTTRRNVLALMGARPNYPNTIGGPSASTISALVQGRKSVLVTVLDMQPAINAGDSNNGSSTNGLLGNQEFNVVRALNSLGINGKAPTPIAPFIIQFVALFGYIWTQDMVLAILAAKGYDVTKTMNPFDIVRNILNISWGNANESSNSNKGKGGRKSYGRRGRSSTYGVLTYDIVAMKIATFVADAKPTYNYTPKNTTVGGMLFVCDASVTKATFSGSTPSHAFSFVKVGDTLYITGMSNLTPANASFVSEPIVHDLPIESKGYMAPATFKLIDELIAKGNMSLSDVKIDGEALVETAIRNGIESAAKFPWSRGFLATNGNTKAVRELDAQYDAVNGAMHRSAEIVAKTYDLVGATS